MKFYPFKAEISDLASLANWEAGIIVEGGHEYNGNLVIRIGDYGVMPSCQDYFLNLNGIKVSKVSNVKYVLEF